MILTAILQAPRGLVLMGLPDKGQDKDQWEARILSPQPKVDFKSPSLTQTYKHQNTPVFQTMDLLSHLQEDRVRHLSMIHLNKHP